MTGTGLQRPRRITADHLSRLAELTERDRRIALDCYDHRALTTEQLTRLHFSNLRVAQRRLLTLYRLRVLERFRPAWREWDGSCPYHWTLDEAGARLVAGLFGIPREQLRWRRDDVLEIARSSKLTHQLAVNEFFTRLARDTRDAGGTLREWWGERRAAAAFSGAVVPDGYGRLEINERSITFLIELDRSTEPQKRLKEKVIRYARALPRSNPRPALVLLLVPTHARAKETEKTLAPIPTPISTAVWTPQTATSPLDLLLHATNAQQKHDLNRKDTA